MAKIHKLTKGGQTIYPATTTDAVVHPTTRKNLTEELVELLNYKILKWNTDLATTRKQVLTKERKTGLIISYINNENQLINEQYDSIDFSDKEWIKNSNWSKIAKEEKIQDLIDSLKIDPSKTTFMDGNLESFFDNISDSQLIAENSKIQVNLNNRTWELVSGTNSIYKIPVDGTKIIYYNRGFKTDYPRMIELDKQEQFLSTRGFSKFSNYTKPSTGRKTQYIVFELENTFDKSSFWMSYADVSNLSTTPKYNEGFDLFYNDGWRNAAKVMIEELMKDSYLSLLYEKNVRFSINQNNIAKIVIGRYRNPVQVIFAKGYIYILKSIDVKTLSSSDQTQASDFFIDALDESKNVSSLWGYYNILAIDRNGLSKIIDDALVHVRFGNFTEAVMREYTNHIYIIGDSLSDSTFTTYNMSYVCELKRTYERLFNFIGFNAIYGDKTLAGFNRLKSFYDQTIDKQFGQLNNWQNRIDNYQLTEDKIKGFCIYIGTNDIVNLTNLSEFSSTYREMIAYIKEKFNEANIMVIIPPKCNKKTESIDYCNGIKSICDENNIAYVDLSVIEELDSTVGDYDYTNYYLEKECIHFNQKGWNLINSLVLPKFTEVMQNQLIKEVGRLASQYTL